MLMNTSTTCSSYWLQVCWTLAQHMLLPEAILLVGLKIQHTGGMLSYTTCVSRQCCSNLNQAASRIAD